MRRLLVILGPTATGKTDLALQFARKFGGELISADSRQIYEGLDIGTGKLPSIESEVKKYKGYWEINEVRIWMYDVTSPKRQYNVSRFAKDATKVIEDIHKRGKLPIIVGGTGFYLKALLEGLSNLAIPVDKKLRQKLSKLSLEQLQKKLQKISPQRWEKMNNSDKKNPRRLIRAVELSIMSPLITPRVLTTLWWRARNDVLKIGLTAPREILYQRIDERVISRLNQGMVEEAVKLHKAGLRLERMRQLGLEYGVLADFLSGKINKANLASILQGKIHGFARRQLTWFKKEKDVNWFDITDKSYLDKVENLIAKWYYYGINIKISTNFKKYAKKN